MSNPSRVLVISAILTLACGSPAQAFADGAEKGSLRFIGQISPFLSGSAGTGSGAPDYSDAFSTGLGAALEYHRRVSERISIIVGVDYGTFSSKTYEGITFDDLNRTSVYGGAKIHFRAQPTDWHPYARMDLGVARISKVDISFENLSGPYWDSGWSPMVDVGAGVEKRFDDWSVFGELLFRYVDEPDSALSPASDADGSWSLPIRIGIGYHF